MNEVYFKKIDLPQLLLNPALIPDILRKVDFGSRLKKNDVVGMKVHFGEKGNKSYINPKILLPLVKYLKKIPTLPFVFDTNTLYRGERTNAIDHINIAQQHGFGKLNVPIIIGDGVRGNNYIEVEINKKHFPRCFLAPVLDDMDFMVVLSHFTGHMLSGFGAAIKNIAMGCASRRGKLAQHSVVCPRIKKEKCIACGVCAQYCPAGAITKVDDVFFINSEQCIGCAQCISVCPQGAVKIEWSEEYGEIGEKIVEYAYAVTQKVPCVYFNFCLYITKECDCMNKESEGFVKDLGVLFGWDPVSVDKASIDLLLRQEGNDCLRAAHPEINYLHHLHYAERIGLGSLEYTLIKL